MKFLKATFHLQLVQNIGCVPCAVQYILEPVLHSIACTSHSAHPCRPAPLLHWLPLVCSLYLWVCFFVMFTSLSCFFDSTYKWYHIVWVFLCLVYFTESVCVWACVLVTQSCPTLCDPMGCSLPDSSVHGIFQAIVLEWIAISFSSGSSQARDRTWVSRIVDRRFTVWATREVMTKLRTKKRQKGWDQSGLSQF